MEENDDRNNCFLECCPRATGDRICGFVGAGVSCQKPGYREDWEEAAKLFLVELFSQYFVYLGNILQERLEQ